jgi:hypothetical protein
VTPFVTGGLESFIAVLARVGVGTLWTRTGAVVSQQAAAGRLAATVGMTGTFMEIDSMLVPLLSGWLAQGSGLAAGSDSCGILGLLPWGPKVRPLAGRPAAATRPRNDVPGLCL